MPMPSYRFVHQASLVLIGFFVCLSEAAAQTPPPGPQPEAAAAPEVAPQPKVAAAPEVAPQPALVAPPPAPPPAPPSDGPKIDVTVPAPAPEVQRDYRMHDGFYLRGNLGTGSLSTTFDDGSPTAEDLDGNGFAFSFDLLVGGSPSPGFSMGGALLSSAAFSSSFERSGVKSDRDASTAMLGVFVDGFPRASGGWHVGGAFGLAQTKVEKQVGDLGKGTLGGLGGAAWFGHDFWVADQLSMGALLRFAGALTTATANNVDTSASSFSTSLMFTTLYN